MGWYGLLFSARIWHVVQLTVRCPGLHCKHAGLACALHCSIKPVCPQVLTSIAAMRAHHTQNGSQAGTYHQINTVSLLARQYSPRASTLHLPVSWPAWLCTPPSQNEPAPMTLQDEPFSYFAVRGLAADAVADAACTCNTHTLQDELTLPLEARRNSPLITIDD